MYFVLRWPSVADGMLKFKSCAKCGFWTCHKHDRLLVNSQCSEQCTGRLFRDWWTGGRCSVHTLSNTLGFSRAVLPVTRLVLWFWNILDACVSNVDSVSDFGTHHQCHLQWCRNVHPSCFGPSPFSTSVSSGAGSTQVVRFRAGPGLLHVCCSFALRSVFGYASSVPLLTASCSLVGLGLLEVWFLPVVQTSAA